MPAKSEFIERKEAAGLVSRRIWNKLHEACPDCNNTQLMVTMVGVLEDENRDFEDNFNTAECKCGWRGPVRDLLPAIKN
jgi:hypothetical protein